MGRPTSRTRGALLALTGLVAVVATACPSPPAGPPVAQNPLTLGVGDVAGDGDAGTSTGVSADGRWVAFSSAATNLVTGDTNGVDDVFLRDRVTGAVDRVAQDVQGPVRISSNGRYVSFADQDRFGVHDRVTGTTEEWPGVSFGVAPIVPDDGSYAVWGATPSSGVPDRCAVRDLTTGVDTDCPSPGLPSEVELLGWSHDGAFVLYRTAWDGPGAPSEVRVWNHQAGTHQTVTEPLGLFFNNNHVSADGRYVTSYGPWNGTSLAGVQLYDTQTGTFSGFGATQGLAVVPYAMTSDAGHLVLLSGDPLVPEDDNGTYDTYVWDLAADTLTLASRDPLDGTVLPSGGVPCGSGPGTVADDGSAVCVSTVDAVAAADTNSERDSYWLPVG